MLSKNVHNNSKAKPAVIWLTGLSASGKTTLAEKLSNNLDILKIENILLDGEDLRDKLMNYSYSTNDRNKIGIYKAKLALEYANNNKIVIITGIAHHKETRRMIRNLLKSYYFEVYLNCPAEICAQRDYKGQYVKAYKGEYKNFIGVTEPYQISKHTELVLDTANMSIENCSETLLKSTLDFVNKP